MRIVDSGVLYRNPLPGHQVVNAYLPFVVELGSGELLSIYRRGTAFYSRDGVLCQLRSADGGRSWVDEGPVWNPERDSSMYTYSAPFIARLPDECLVLAAFRVECSDPNKLVVNPSTGAFLPAETILIRSADQGRTWSAPQIIELPAGVLAYLSGPVIEMANGEWLLPFDKGKAYDDPNPLSPVMLALFSPDRGATWSDVVRLADGVQYNRAHWHGRFVQLLDSRIFTLLWTQDTTTGKFIDLHRMTSDASGRNWDTPQPTGLIGQTCWAVDLGNDRMFAAYTVREAQPPGIYGAISADGGRTWDADSRVVLWDATGRETVGVASRNTYPASHDTIAFGRPQATRLANGEVIVSFWCTEAAVTCARWARVAVS
jgi:sialidase-1